MIKIIIPILTTLIGALISYTARPSIFGWSPTFTEWFFSEFTVRDGWIQTIGIYAAVGLIVGIVLAIIVGQVTAPRPTTTDRTV